jgi:Protein of unknown function (DUF2637)
VKIFIRVVMGLVALAAGALSFQSLTHLGELCGYGWLSFAYPLTLDLGAAASCAAWIHERNRQALGMTWAMLAISVVLNGTLHYLQTAGTAPSWLLVVLVAAVPPAVFGLVVHLAVGQQHVAESDLAAGTNQLAEIFTKDDPNLGSEVIDTDPLLDRARALMPIGRPKLAETLEVSDWKARQLLSQLSSNGHGGDAS